VYNELGTLERAGLLRDLRQFERAQRFTSAFAENISRDSIFAAFKRANGKLFAPCTRESST
jgi:hypothetical protein